MKNNNEVLIQIGERIRTKRKELALTQKELASLADVSVATIKKLEKGLHKPTPNSLSKIAAALNVSAKYLKFGQQSVENKANILQIPILDVDLNEYESAPIWEKFIPKYNVVGLEEEFKKSLRVILIEDNVYILSKFSESFLDLCLTDIKVRERLKKQALILYKKNQKKFISVYVFEDGSMKELGGGEFTSDLNSFFESELDDYIIVGQIQ